MTVSKEFLVLAAARNNAEWCAAMCRSHGLASVFGPQDWTAAVRTPLFYPDAVTLVPTADAAMLVDRIDTSAPGASVKDSFADFDLTGSGFGVLFEAWPVILAALHGLFPSVPVVGYEHGQDVAASARHGFEPVGPLRVWMHGR
ncbi:MAG TPA: hypothetical protein VHG10_11975 [Glycomyces sp.]|nr:hypothetical protein [Glycomyces sp.]